MLKLMKRVIQDIATKLPDIVAVYGFGSFFRGTIYKDIDLVFVVKNSCSNRLLVLRELRELTAATEIHLGIPIDIIFLTETEFQGEPLMESNNLHELYLAN